MEGITFYLVPVADEISPNKKVYRAYVKTNVGYRLVKNNMPATAGTAPYLGMAIPVGSLAYDNILGEMIAHGTKMSRPSVGSAALCKGAQGSVRFTDPRQNCYNTT